MGAIAKIETQSGWTVEQVELVRRTICKGATDDEMQLFISQCKRTGLDPFSRQIHAVKRWDGREKREVMTIQTGIDGYRLIADRTGKYAGNDDPVYDRDDTPHPNKATVTVWKIVEDQRVPFTRSARWSEFVQTTKDGTVTRFWAKMPFLMLGKVAEALALRAAFPQELSGLYTHEEMGQADNDRDNEPARPAIAAAPRQQKAAPAAEPVENRTTSAGAQPQRPQPTTEPAPKASNLPANGAELFQRLTDFDAKLAKEGTCKPGELLDHVLSQGVKVCGYPGTLLQWSGDAAMNFAVDEVKKFIALRQKKAAPAATVTNGLPNAKDPDGVHLSNWLRQEGVKVHTAGACENETDLQDYIRGQGVENDLPRDISQWQGHAIESAVRLAQKWVQEKLVAQPVAA